MTEPTASSRKGKTGPMQQCKTQFEWASNHIKSQCTVGNRFIGFDHEHLSRKQKVSMTAPSNISVASTKHNDNSARRNSYSKCSSSIRTKKCNELEIDWWNYTQNLYAATSPDQLHPDNVLSQTKAIKFICPLRFFNVAHSPSRYTIITWVYLVLWILCKFVDLPDSNTLSKPSTPMEDFNEVHEGTWIWRNGTFLSIQPAIKHINL